MENYMSRARAIYGGSHPDDPLAPRFALVHAAGCLAIDCGVLPWTHAELYEAVRFCHWQADFAAHPVLALRQADPKPLVASYIRENRVHFLSHKPASEPLDTAVAKSAAGIVYVSQRGDVEFLFSRAVFRERVCFGHDSNHVLRALSEGGYLNRYHRPHSSYGAWVVNRAVNPARPCFVSIRESILDN